MAENTTTAVETDEEKKKKKRIFIYRLIAFILFGAVAPVVFIMWRYGIFDPSSYEGSRGGVAWGFWTFLCALVLLIVLKYILDEVRAVTPYSMFSQVATGFTKVVIPLLVLYFAVVALKNSLEYFSQAVLATTLCESVAVVVNPFPQWAHEHNVDMQEMGFRKFSEIFISKWKDKEK